MNIAPRPKVLERAVCIAKEVRGFANSDRFEAPKFRELVRFSMGEVLRRFRVPEIAFPRVRKLPWFCRFWRFRASMGPEDRKVAAVSRVLEFLVLLGCDGF